MCLRDLWVMAADVCSMLFVCHREFCWSRRLVYDFWRILIICYESYAG